MASSQISLKLSTKTTSTPTALWVVTRPHIISEFIEDITYSSRFDNCELTVVFFCLSGISIRHRGLAAWLLGYLACLCAFVLNDKGDCNKGEATPKLLECWMHPSTRSCFLGEGTSYCLLILTKSRWPLFALLLGLEQAQPDEGNIHLKLLTSFSTTARLSALQKRLMRCYR